MSNHTAASPAWMTREYFQGVLRTFLGDDSITVTTFEVSPGSSVGDNYACQIFRVRTDYAKQNKPDSLTFIGKLLPHTELVKKLTKNFDFFGVEADMLVETLSLIYRRFPEAEPFSPRTYHLDDEHKIIYLEDLRADGYVMVDRNRRSLDMRHCELVVKALARFHAYSLLLIRERPELKERYKNTFWKKDDAGVVENLLATGLENLLESAESWPITEDQRNKLRSLDGRICELGYSGYERRADAFNVILHGDCWVNNMMFRYNTGSTVEAVKLIDFQLSNYNSIGLDLNYFLFTSADIDVLMNGTDRLFGVYHETFSGIVKDLPDFTVEAVRREFLDRLSYGFICGFVFRAGVLDPNAFDLDAVAGDRNKEANKAMYHRETYIGHCVRLLPFFEQHGVL